jgi:hypothetical protein
MYTRPQHVPDKNQIQLQGSDHAKQSLQLRLNYAVHGSIVGTENCKILIPQWTNQIV